MIARDIHHVRNRNDGIYNPIAYGDALDLVVMLNGIRNPRDSFAGGIANTTRSMK